MKFYDLPVIEINPGDPMPDSCDRCGNKEGYYLAHQLQVDANQFFNDKGELIKEEIVGSKEGYLQIVCCSSCTTQLKINNHRIKIIR